MKSIFIAVSLILIFSSCRVEEASIPNINVEEDFVPYVNAFIEEGAKRGHEIDFEDTGLTIVFGNIPTASASCSEIAGPNEGSHQIIVNKNAWEALNDTLRERLIFHELGHCELGRIHKNDKFSDGSWRSIMRGDPLSQVDERLPVPYFGFRRDYYIDELFNDHTPSPGWASYNFDYNDLETAALNPLITRSNLEKLSDTINLALENYELEFEVKTISGEEATWLAWGTEAKHYFFWLRENEFHFAANSNFQGPFHFIESETLDFRERQKITIRQHEALCKVFINEKFFFAVDRLPSDLFFIMSSTENEILIESFRLSEIID